MPTRKAIRLDESQLAALPRAWPTDLDLLPVLERMLEHSIDMLIPGGSPKIARFATGRAS